MVAENFDRSYARVRVSEGGNVDDSHDPGGRTSRGCTQRNYNAWCSLRKLPRGDVWHAPDAHIKAIFKEQFWDRAGCDRVPAGVDYALFDAAINSGPAQAKKWLQRALGETRIDGIIGHLTEAHLAASDPAEVAGALCDRRLAFMQHLHTWPRYRKGWSRRVAEVRAAAIAMAAGAEPEHAPTYLAGMHEKATMADAPRLPSPSLADASTGAGAVSMAISGLQDKLTPYADSVDWLKPVLVALIVAGVVVTGGGLAIGWWVRRRRAALADALDLVEVRAGEGPPEAAPAPPPDDDAPSEAATAGAAA